MDYFQVLCADSAYIDLRNVDELEWNNYDENTIKHPSFQKLLSCNYLGIKAFTYSSIIVDNHIKAIDMIVKDNIPLYTGRVIDITEEISIDNLVEQNEVNFQSSQMQIDDPEIS